MRIAVPDITDGATPGMEGCTATGFPKTIVGDDAIGGKECSMTSYMQKSQLMITKSIYCQLG